MKRKIAALISLALVCGACFGGPTKAPSVFSVAEITGAAQGRFPGDTGWRAVKDGEQVPAGTRVRLIGASDALKLMRGEQIEVELRANEGGVEGDAAAEATIVSLDEVAVQTGDLLARTGGAQQISLRSADDGIVARSSDGIFRLDRRVSLRVGVYQGTVTVSGPSGDTEVARLREVQPRNGVPGTPIPLGIDDDDAWDARFLGPTLDLERDLEAQIAGYEGEFGKRTRSVDELSSIARDTRRDLGFVSGELDRFPSGDILVGLVIALLVDARGGADAATGFAELLEMRGSGASWGVIAADRDAEPAEVLSGVVRAIGLRTGVVTPGKGPSIIPSGSPKPRSTTSRRPSSRPTTTRTPTPTPTKSPTPRPSPTPSPSPSPTSTPCSDVDVLLGNC